MKIGLHELKHLVAQIINEGKVADELKELQRLHPREANALSGTPFFDPNGQPTKWFKWLLPRFLTKKIKEEFALAFDHVVDTVRRYARKEQALSEAFRQQAFKEALVATLPGNFNLNKIRDPSQLNIREMDSILDVLSEYDEKKKDLLGIDYDAIDIEGDKLGKIGPWNIWMPTTRENSCTIVRVRDPATGKMKASPCNWCTIRTEDSNLFYGYTARSDADIILYYLIRDNPEIYNIKNEDFISIGFLNGKLDTTGTAGGITVSCNNTGLREEDLKRIFDVNYTSIINLLTQKTKEIGGQHPAKTKLLAARKSLEGLNYLMKGISREERAELALQVLGVSDEDDYYAYSKVIENIDLSVKNACFEYAAASKKYEILEAIINNKYCSPHVLEKLFFNYEDYDFEIIYKVFNNPNFPKHIKNNLELLSTHKDEIIREITAHNPNCSPEILRNLSQDPNPKVASAAQKIMKKRGIQLESLRRKISKLIYAVR